MAKRKSTNNDLQNIHVKLKMEQHEPYYNFVKNPSRMDELKIDQHEPHQITGMYPSAREG